MNRRSWGTMVLVGATMVTVACPPGGGDSSVRKIMYPIFIGTDLNNFNIEKIYYAGPRVARFKLVFRVVQPGRTTGWTEGATLRLVSMGGTTLEEIVRNDDDPRAEHESGFIAGNAVRIQFNSNGFVRLGLRSRLEIVRVELEFLDDNAPSPEPFRLRQGQEVIVLSPDVTNGRQDFSFTQPAGSDNCSVYISPFHMAAEHEVGAAAAIGSRVPSTTFIHPVAGDTGIYDEQWLPAGEQLHVAVTMELSTHYTIMVQRLAARHDVAIEMDGTLTYGEAAFDRSAYVDAVLNSDPVGEPNYRQIANFTHRTASFPRRVHEVVIIATASALGASEGFLRFDNVYIYHSVDPFRDVDYVFRDACGRAFAGRNHVAMFINSLYDPPMGGRVFMHEFGHWDYGMADEYLDIRGDIFSEPLDWNTIMGSPFTNEFCSYGNHIWSPQVPRPGATSNWMFLAARYDIRPTGPPNSLFYPQNQGTYMDVLNKLEEVVSVVHYPNANPSPPVSHPTCP